MLKIAIITGSTRPGRNNEAVSNWIQEKAAQRSDAEFELVDIANSAHSGIGHSRHR
jgi:NAD(P)H-dependent FMN reductase